MAMPKSAVNHIQNNAPGPPSVIAVATPAILPVPMVALSEVINARNGGISPSPCPLNPPSSKRNANASRFQVRKPKPMVRKTPVPNNSTCMGTPHAQALISVMIASMSPLSNYRFVKHANAPSISALDRRWLMATNDSKQSAGVNGRA